MPMPIMNLTLFLVCLASKENKNPSCSSCQCKEGRGNCHLEQVRENVADSSKFKSLGPDGFQPRILMELIKQIPELLSVIFEKCGTGETPEDWRRATVIIIFKKVNKEGSQTFQLDCTGQTLQTACCEQLDRCVIINKKPKWVCHSTSCQINCTSFFERLTSLVGQKNLQT